MTDRAMKYDNTVHLVDPDAGVGQALSILLGLYDIRVRTYMDAETFLAAHSTGKPGYGCLFIEYELPDMNGLELLRELRNQDFNLPSIILTGAASRELRKQAFRLGAVDVIEKPLMYTFLLERLAQLLPHSASLFTQPLSTLELHDGTRVKFRVMRPQDADIEQAFVRGLSKRSNRLRFFSAIKELPPDVLERFTNPDYPHSYALIATVREGDEERQIGVARYLVTESDGVAEFAIVVADKWQVQGIATYLLSGLSAAATVAGVKRLEGFALNENDSMRKLARALDFSITRCREDATIFRVAKTLRSAD